MLHIVNKSPFDKNSLDKCVDLAAEGGAILLIEDAVYAAKKNSDFADKLKSVVGKCSVNVLGPDFNSRGFADEDVLEGVNVVDHHGFVDLVEKNGTVQSWL
jgi:tRNA 2-thiouridine synthesizing protein B